MAGESACWGIELGSGAIKALKLGATGEGGVEVLDFIVIPHKKVLSTPDIDPDDALRVAVGQLASQYDLSGAPIAVSVPGNQSFARFAKLPPVEPKNVEGVVKFEAGQQIPFDLSEVEWDYQTFVSADSPDVEVGIFAITKQRIERELTLLRDVGLNPDTITVSPVAVYNAMAYDLQFTEDTPGTVIMDVGTNSTDLIVADGGRVWIRTFPIGGHHFTEALVDKFKLSYAKAERLKREAERSKHARHVFQAMKGVFADLAQETQRSIGYHKSLHPNSDLKRVIGVGSTFKLPGLRRFLKQQLQLDVYRMDEYKRLSLDGPRAGEFGAVSVEMPVAYGLALQGLGYQTIDANLMPVTLVREGVWQRKTKWFGMAAALGLTGAAAMFIRWAIDNNEVATSEQPQMIKTAMDRARLLKSEADQAGVTGGAVVDPEAQTLLSLPEGRDVYAHVVADLSEMLAATDRQASDGSGFSLKSFQSQFVPAGAGAGPDTGGRGSRGGFGAVQEEEKYPDADKIDIVIDIETDEARADTFLLQTIRPWLLANADRDSVPYVILAKQDLDYTDLAAGGAAGWRGNSFEIARGGGGELAGGGDVVGGGYGREGESLKGGGLGDEVDLSDLAAQQGGRPAPRRGERQPGRSFSSGGNVNLNQVAPLPARPDGGDGEPSVFQVRYRLALVPVSERERSADSASGEEDGE